MRSRKEGQMMTQNQIAYRKALEEERSNRAQEELRNKELAETKRSNLEKEFQEYGKEASALAQDTHWGTYSGNDNRYGTDRALVEFAQGARQAGEFVKSVLPFSISFKA